MSKLPEDLARFLFLVPYVAQHEEGVPVSELCEQLSTDVASLRRLIERVAMVGSPDGSPDEMVEIYLEGDRVFVALPQRFTRPPRFSIEEMLALLVALAPLREGDLPTLRSQAQALTDRLLSLSSERAEAVAPALLQRVVIRADGAESPVHLRDLECAVQGHRVVDAEYYTAGRDALTQRELRPVGLLQVRGAWYVVGNDGKTFKVERFRRIALRDDTFVPAEVDLAELRRRLATRRIHGEMTDLELRIGDKTSRYPARSLHSLVRWVRTSRGRVAVVGPAEARSAIADEMKALLARYERRSPSKLPETAKRSEAEER
ncbi:MAG: WYL domain-containing protein [Myxococcota bacterium]